MLNRAQLVCFTVAAAALSVFVSPLYAQSGTCSSDTLYVAETVSLSAEPSHPDSRSRTLFKNDKTVCLQAEDGYLQVKYVGDELAVRFTGDNKNRVGWLPSDALMQNQKNTEPKQAEADYTGEISPNYVGNSREELIEAYGYPDKVNSSGDARGVTYQYIYRDGNNVSYVYLRNDVIRSIQNL